MAEVPDSAAAAAGQTLDVVEDGLSMLSDIAAEEHRRHG
jgi:hypothetical protein